MFIFVSMKGRPRSLHPGLPLIHSPHSTQHRTGACLLRDLMQTLGIRRTASMMLWVFCREMCSLSLRD